jgi:hypothetical protein
LDVEMLVIFCLLLIFVVAWSQSREGLLSAAIVLGNVLLAGILTFNFWEPLADELEAQFADGPLAGYEDALALTFLFAVFMTLLRLVSARLLPRATLASSHAQQLGGGALGVVAGYLVAGFVVCILQTLPWHENFWGFRPRRDNESAMREFLPPDRVWLGLMRYSGAAPLAWQRAAPNSTFDAGLSFEERYRLYRRYGDERGPLKYEGERDRELGKEKPR